MPYSAVHSLSVLGSRGTSVWYIASVTRTSAGGPKFPLLDNVGAGVLVGQLGGCEIYYFSMGGFKSGGQTLTHPRHFFNNSWPVHLVQKACQRVLLRSKKF